MLLIYFGQWQNEIINFFLYAANSGRRRNLDTKGFLQKQQEMKISDGYNLINGAKLCYQVMQTS
jgi:hypothetical protein